MTLPTGPHYSMPTPYFVLRKISPRPVDMGDQAYYVGHFPRRLLAWLPPKAKWEKYHLPTHEGLYRFASKDEAARYILAHKDMKGGLIESVSVETSPKDGEPFWVKEAPFD